MHGFDFSIPLFVIRVRDTCIVVTLDIVSDVLCVLRVEHPDYSGCDWSSDVCSSDLVTCPSVLIQEFYSKMHGFDYSVPNFITSV